MLTICRFGLLVFLAGFLLSCSPPPSSALNIATAANGQFAMEALTKSFAEKTGIPTHIILNSSGKLTAQIQQGAPYDLFVSANMKYPEALHTAGKTYQEPQIYAYGKLVLWTVKAEMEVSWEGLEDISVAHIALANPKTAPYGEATQEALQQKGLWEVVEKKLVYGESIAQTNQFILSQSADMGFTAKSVVMDPSMKGRGRWMEVGQELYSPIAQGVAVIQRGQSEKELQKAMTFYNFLFSPTAQNILRIYGYHPATE